MIYFQDFRLDMLRYQIDCKSSLAVQPDRIFGVQPEQRLAQTLLKEVEMHGHELLEGHV